MWLRKFIFLIISALFSASLAGAIVTIPASAASFGAGYNTEGGPIGNWIVDGQRTYCIEISSAAPISASKGSNVVTNLTTDPVGYSGSGNPTTTTSGVNLAKANWVLANYGDTSNNRQAAAVQLWIWTHLSYNEFVARGGGSFSVSWNYHLGWVPSAQRTAVVNIYNQIESAANQAINSLPSAAPAISSTKNLLTDTATLSLSGNTAWKGELKVSANTGTAEFSAGEDTIVTEGGSTSEVSFTRDTAGSYDFQVSGTLTSWPAQIRVWNRPSTWQQMTVGAVSPTKVSISLGINAQNDAKFIPVLSTKVQSGPEKEHLRTGAYLVDKVNFGIAAESMSWPETSEGPVNIKLRYVIYGPFYAQPQQDLAPPEDAPIFESGETSSSFTSEIQQQSFSKVTQPGWYSWVWSIHAEDQASNVKNIMPASYIFADDFGDPAETIEVVPQMTIRLETKAQENVHAPGGPLSDLITVSTNGAPWALNADGEPIKITLRASVWEICDVENLPNETNTAPENATQIFSTDFSITSAAEYLVTSGEGIQGSGCAGYGTWQISALPVGGISETYGHWLANPDSPASHAFFLPEESFRISPPVFSSKTSDLVMLGDESHDNLIVEGLILGEPYSQWQISEWQLHRFEFDEEISTEICGAETLHRASTDAVTIPEGNYSGQQVVKSNTEIITEIGKYQWVALIENLVTGESILHGCGELSQQFLAIAPAPAFAHSGVSEGTWPHGWLGALAAGIPILLGLLLLNSQLSRRSK